MFKQILLVGVAAIAANAHHNATGNATTPHNMTANATADAVALQYRYNQGYYYRRPSTFSKVKRAIRRAGHEARDAAREAVRWYGQNKNKQFGLKVDFQKLTKFGREFMKASKTANAQKKAAQKTQMQSFQSAYATAVAKITLNFSRLVPAMIKKYADMLEKNSAVKGNAECVAKCMYFYPRHFPFLRVRGSCVRKCGVKRPYDHKQRQQSRSAFRSSKRTLFRFMRSLGREFAGKINQAMRKQKDATNRINRTWARNMRNFAKQYVKDSFKFSLKLAEKDEAELKSQVDQATWDHYLANREAMIDAIVPTNEDITEFIV